VVRWHPPSPLAGISIADEVFILERICAGTEDGEQYTAAHQASGSDRYAGRVIVELTGRFTKNAKTESEAQNIIRLWLQSGMLRQSEYFSLERRSKRTCCVVDLERLAQLRKESDA
jgi:hypothetical protein